MNFSYFQNSIFGYNFYQTLETYLTKHFHAQFVIQICCDTFINIAKNELSKFVSSLAVFLTAFLLYSERAQNGEAAWIQSGETALKEQVLW